MAFAEIMLKTLWKALAICSVCVACSKNTSTQQTQKLTTIDFINFTCIDLSEDQVQLSTMDDEVIVFYGYLNMSAQDTIVSSNLFSTSLHIIKKNLSTNINKTIELNNNAMTSLLFIGLIEVDDDISISKMLLDLKSKFNQIHVSSINGNWEKVIKASPSNDNLGFVLQRLRSGQNTYLIAGNQLTDRYEYHFNVNIK